MKNLNEWSQLYRERANGIRRYTFREALPAMLTAREGHPVLGCDMHGNPVSVDLDHESPHIALSIASGGGKSETLKSLAIQLARSGAKVIILDWKRHSHRWARHVPGITYCRDIDDIHDTLQGVALKGRKRYLSADKLSDAEYDSGEWRGERIVLLIEELNGTMAELTDYWLDIRPTGRGYQAPRRSPAVKAFHELLSMGRAANINIIAVAQRLSTESLGGAGGYGKGADARENFAIRILGRYTMNTWRMLVPEIEFIPANENVGRVQLCVAGKATEVQTLYVENDRDAIDYATGKDFVVNEVNSRKDMEGGLDGFVQAQDR